MRQHTLEKIFFEGQKAGHSAIRSEERSPNDVIFSTIVWEEDDNTKIVTSNNCEDLGFSDAVSLERKPKGTQKILNLVEMEEGRDIPEEMLIWG